jgi:Icc-related predicted phosphoesterase
MKTPLRLAAVADLHCKTSSRGQIAPLFNRVCDLADALLLCGDLTDYGLPEEAEVLADELESVIKRIPVLTILGNHDFESGKPFEVLEVLSQRGFIPLESGNYEFRGVEFIGTKGFAGGFDKRILKPWGEEAVKSFVMECKREAVDLDLRLTNLTSQEQVVLLHYSPIRETVMGESPEIFPFLGSSFLEETLDRHPVRVVFHGHAHGGSPFGYTTGRIPVFNVTLALMKQLFSEKTPYRLFQVDGASSMAIETEDVRAKTARRYSGRSMDINSPFPEGMRPEDPRHLIYRNALDILNAADFNFLVGGTFALNFYMGTQRETKDIDLFILPEDYEAGLEILARAGFQTEQTFPHWLGKATHGEHQIDIIFSSGNAIGKVDSRWFEHAVAGEALGTPLKFCPVEEMIWSKAFVMERERYDGADIIHFLLTRGETLDWSRLLDRFGDHWRVLFSYLVLFGYVYPSKVSQIPKWVMESLLDRLSHEEKEPDSQTRICRGTLLSRVQYRVDIEERGYIDARLRPFGEMTAEEILHWSAPDPG